MPMEERWSSLLPIGVITMEIFLTSSQCIPSAPEAILNPANDFVERLRSALPKYPKVLTVCSDPNGHDLTVYYAKATEEAFVKAGMPYGAHCVLDGCNPEQARDLLAWCDFLILSGGHVPTQNRFFQEIGLKELLSDFDGVIMGISAGSMNAARVVYAQPEREGESVDPAYQRFLPGLGLTENQILPHYNTEKDAVLDGKRLYEDITYPDSFGKRFLVLPDGSYVHIKNGKSTIYGGVYWLTDGMMKPYHS